MGTWPLCLISFVETECSVVKRSATVSCQLRWNPTAEWPLACSSIGVMLPQRTVRSTALTGLLVLTVTATAFANPSAKNPKIDRAVRAAMQAGVTTQRVIITVKAGYRDSLRQALTSHG